MLLFIDQPKHIRVLRTMPDASGTIKRERLGLITKQTLEPTPELAAAIQPDEKDEVDKALEMYRRSQEIQKQAAALNFPETMRIVTDYLQNGANDSERKIIVAALMEAVRQIRKAAKQEAEEVV
jgi:urease gamma subunit